MDKVRKHIIFYGRVQGVGFRYTACYLARPLGLTGWVKNLWDGSVEMEVQGPNEEIEIFLHRLQNGRFIQVDRMDIREIPAEKEHDFVEIWN
ncbi:acylphosphatase [Clostridium sp. MCC353]|uniref:acylphosphatase n=1 Tax=Clostridium sp. MCC353 TaxID=2592646 RepID=UPI001C035B97|nr:acylphosphatase [Clostridium sp. MCC353]MBT9778024.1 acylphosphatase [Clostridium sp. MCC353]